MRREGSGCLTARAGTVVKTSDHHQRHFLTQCPVKAWRVMYLRFVYLLNAQLFIQGYLLWLSHRQPGQEKHILEH